MAISADAAKVTAGGVTAADFITAIYTYVNGTSTRFDVVNYTAGEALTIEPAASLDYSFQLNIRRNGATAFKFLIDPSSGITDEGDSSTSPTTSADASAEVGFTLSGTPHADLLICETDDAFMFLIQDTTRNFDLFGYQGGLIFSPNDESDPANGIEGYGILSGIPRFTASSGTGYMLSTSTTSSTIKIINTWMIPAMLTTSGQLHNNRLESATMQKGVPVPLVAYASGPIYFYCGNSKYFRLMAYDDKHFPHVRSELATTEGWVFTNYTNSSDQYVFTWKVGVAVA